MKWGNKYGAEYANRLFRSIQRTYSKPFEFYCLTDDPTGLECKTIDISSWPHYSSTVFTIPKMDAFKFLDLEGPFVLFDLDVLVTKDLAPYLDQYNFSEPRFIWNYWEDTSRLFRTHHRGDCMVNSSFVTWNNGQLDKLYDLFESNPKLFTYKFRSFDKFLHYCGNNLFGYHPRGIVYAYNYGAEFPNDLQPNKFREQYSVVLFNTSHGQGVELHDCEGWARELWVSN